LGSAVGAVNLGRAWHCIVLGQCRGVWGHTLERGESLRKVTEVGQTQCPRFENREVGFLNHEADAQNP